MSERSERTGEARLEGSPARAWYLVARSREVRRDAVASFRVADREVVAFRDGDGRARVVAPHCPHLGAHLRHATVRDGTIRCAIHHLCFDGDGRWLSRRGSAGDLRLASYTVDERHSAVFVCFSDRPSTSLDDVFDGESGAPYSRARTFDVTCEWDGIVANAFDVAHLETVHRRRLAGKPSVTRQTATDFSLRYRSHVVGRGLADRVMGRIAPAGVEVEVVCHGGTLVSVASRAGRHSARLVAALTPRGDSTSVALFASVPRGRSRPLDACRLLVATKLYESFLRRDLRILDGMRLAPRHLLPEDAVLAEFLEYLGALVEDDAMPHLRAVARPIATKRGSD